MTNQELETAMVAHEWGRRESFGAECRQTEKGEG